MGADIGVLFFGEWVEGGWMVLVLSSIRAVGHAAATFCPPIVPRCTSMRV